MTNKNMIFFFLSASFVVLTAAQSLAVETLAPEDEELFWEVKAGDNNTVKETLYELTDAVYDEKGNLIIRQQQKIPSLGIPVQSIPVPPEINAKAPLYDNPAILKANPNTPRSLNYPIGRERDAVNAPLLEPFDENLNFAPKEKKQNPFHQARIDAYRDDINNCIDSRKDRLEMELAFISQGEVYNNAAYLSQTFSEIEQCYDSIGLDIIEEFYTNDNDTLREYNHRTENFHVKSSDPNFNAKYCKETCSMEAIAELQMEKFADFRTYLAELLENAPVQAVTSAPNTPYAPDEDIEIPNDVLLIDEAELTPPPARYRSAPQALRFKTPDGKEQIVRRTSAPQQYQRPVQKQRTEPVAERPLRFDYDGVPFIDEQDL